jgi:hypothetical protein
MSAPPEEKRRTPRIQPFVAPCQVVAGETRISGYVTELSLEGARVSCDDDPPAADSQVVLEVRLPRQATRSRLNGRVKWARAADEGRRGHVFGVTFEGLGAEEQANVAAVLAEFRRLAAELA